MKEKDRKDWKIALDVYKRHKKGLIAMGLVGTDMTEEEISEMLKRCGFTPSEIDELAPSLVKKGDHL